MKFATITLRSKMEHPWGRITLFGYIIEHKNFNLLVLVIL